jgi:hypothetical protein
MKIITDQGEHNHDYLSHITNLPFFFSLPFICEMPTMLPNIYEKIPSIGKQHISVYSAQVATRDLAGRILF